ncbi:response regulator [Vallitalea okinawensis]|uniref:response regulator n=1 Tax=Vallitalea okinawensis TaxID=2078660 RepID=UPI000CFC43C3|nr:response regulator [Vallitalea okinawensis]
MEKYKVLLVDDDCLVRQTLRNMLNWKELGLTIVDEAIDGKDGMDKIDHLIPDIIILDMSMPQADGIEVIQHIKNNNYPVRILALSCYDDFTYVKEALKLGASDYILKHLLQKEVLVEALGAIREEIEKSKSEKEIKTQLRVLANEGRPLLKNKLLMGLLQGENHLKELEGDFKRYCKNLPLNNLSLIYLTVENYQHVIMDFQPRGEEIFTLALTNIVKEVVGKTHHNEVVDLGKGNYTIILHLNNRGHSQNKVILEDIIRRVNRQLKSYLKAETKMITNMESVSYNDLPVLFHELDSKKGYFFYEDYSINFLFSNLIQPLSMAEIKAESEDLEYYKNHIKKMEFDELESYLLKGLENHRVKLIQPDQLRKYYHFLVRVIQDYVHEHLHILSDEIISSNETNSMSSIRHITQMEEFIIQLVSELREFMADALVENVDNDYVKEAIKFIQGHYMEDINLAEVAAHIHVTRTYLSHLFNQTTGTKFIDYVREVRMKKACDYLSNSNMTIKEIAIKVGIPNRKYFSKTFKHVIGISPQEFKRVNI